MKHSIPTFCILIALLASTNFSWGQIHFIDGYIVKNNGDTLKGMISYKGKRVPEQICVFKRFDIALPLKYSNQKIASYGFKNGNQYELKDVLGEKLFVESLVKGKINLYAYGSRFFIEKNNRGFMELRTRPTTVFRSNGEFTYENYREYLAAQTDDNEGFTLPVDLSLDAEKLISAIASYNSLNNGYNKIIERNVDRSDYMDAIIHSPLKMNSFGIVVSLNTNRTELHPIIRNNSTSVVGVTNRDWYMGAYIGRKVSRDPKALTIFGEVTLASENEEFGLEYSLNYPDEDQSFRINTSTVHLKIPVYAQYNFAVSKLIPFANAGLAINYRWVNKMEGTLIAVDNQSQTKSFEIDHSKFKETNNRLSAFVGVGVKQRIFGLVDLSLETRVELMAYYHAHYPDVILNNYQYYEFNYLYSPKVEVAQCSPLVTFILRIGI